MNARRALAIGHRVRLLEKVRSSPSGYDLNVPCPEPGCAGVLHCHPTGDGAVCVFTPCDRRHRWTWAHSDAVRALVSDYIGWFREQQREPIPF